MEQQFCQSCGMPLTDENRGTNADGSRSEDYCAVLLQKRRVHPRVHDEPNDRVLSAILRPMEYADGVQVDSHTSERNKCSGTFPHLKRWKVKDERILTEKGNALACPMRKRDRRFHRRLRISSPCADVQDRMLKGFHEVWMATSVRLRER